MLRLTNTLPACFFFIFLFLPSLFAYQVKAQCTFTAPAGPVCAGDPCEGQEASFQGPANATSYAWDFGVQNETTDTSSVANPSYRYEQPGTYTVTLNATINGQDRQ